MPTTLPEAVLSQQFGDTKEVSPGHTLLRVGAPPCALEAQGFVSPALGTKFSTELGRSEYLLSEQMRDYP